jgi:uncharacterized damage-inducible protein DinB
MHPVAALFDREAWATRELLDACATLDSDVLDREAAGTRGSIRATLTHLVGTEQAYLAELTGERAADPIQRGERRDPASLAPLATENAERWLTIVRSPADADWVLLVQCVHHGDQHRAHVGTALSAAGLPGPELDGPAYFSRAPRDDWAPGAWADALLPRFFAYSAWATGVLLDHCHVLGEPALRATAPGTYGPALDTLAHVIDVDGSYLSWLTGVPEVPVNARMDRDALRRRAASWRDGWAAHLDGAPDHERLVRAGAGREVPAWLLTLQAVHHANDHRAHTGTVLGANGLPVPEMDVRTFARASA